MALSLPLLRKPNSVGRPPGRAWPPPRTGHAGPEPSAAELPFLPTERPDGFAMMCQTRRSRMSKQIGYVVGSLRKDSWNRKLANALIKLAPPDFNFKELRIGDLPLYDQDDDRSQAPEVQRLKSELRGWMPSCSSPPSTTAPFPGCSRTRWIMPRGPTGKAPGPESPPGVIGASLGRRRYGGGAAPPAHHPGLPRHADPGTARGLYPGEGRLLR